MKICSRSTLVFMWFIYVTIQGLEAQRVKVEPEVTGYVGHDVTLPCQLIPGPNHNIITQVQWELKQLNGEKRFILVSNELLGVSTYETFLKDRLNIMGQSLIIRSVETRDAGLYTCSIATFPAGSFEGTTNFVVQDHQQMLMLPRVIAAGVFVLIVVTMFATTYFIITRIRHRCEALVMQRVGTDTVSPAISD